MFSNVRHSVPLLRVRIENAFHHVSCVLGDELGDLEISRQDLLVEVACVCILKWKVATYKSKENDTNGPDVYMRAMVTLTSDHLGGGIARRSTGCLQGLTSLVCVTQTKVNNLDVLVVIE